MSETHRLTEQAACKILRSFRRYYRNEKDARELYKDIYEILMWFGDELYNLD